ncbi:flagellar motor switch/type III secretory pathway protein FliN [Xanthomonas arboricola]|uniref:FliM/FliN family flagellar motor switch protein n=1 Tax=Xanthomonas cannabis TaxID=1885674 RepID=UPI0016143966|nr:FliM/FliN family flagellar motor switch protein [Xanthomonas cannabis]MBB3804627.1 flagellar motor switch/type III secretory pathway protein FliN [Xanthomonas cannabis]
MKRLGWIRPGSAQKLCDTLQSRCGQWLDAWSVSPGQAEQRVYVASAQPSVHAEDLMRWQLGDAGTAGLLGIRLRNASHAALGAGLMSLSSAADVEVCGKVGEEALRALLDTLMGNECQKMRGRSESIDQDRLLPRHGALHAIARWNSIEIEVMADATWCASQVGSFDDSPLVKLLSRSAALGSQAIGLHAQLVLGEIELADVSTLRIGEVLVVDSDMNAALQLMSGDHVLATARLVVADDKRALELH